MNAPTGHLGDLLSALLDGEMEYEEAAAARAHLQACPFCRAELDATASTRTLVRSLPMMDPPAGLIDGILAIPEPEPDAHTGAAPDEGGVVPITAGRRRAGRNRPLVAIAGIAAAVAMFAIVVTPHQSRTVKPPVSTFVDAHATSFSGDDPITGLAPVAVPASFAP